MIVHNIMKNGRIFIAVSILIAMIITIIVVRNYIFQAVAAYGHSMEPVIRHGDRILVDIRSYKTHRPDKGDIIAFRVGWRVLIKRVVGLPGDVIELKNGILYCNSRQVEISHPSPLSDRLRRRSFSPLKVWDRHVFVMGDNIEHSIDSRNFGMILYSDIIGKALLIYFPPGRIKKLDSHLTKIS